MEIKRFDKELVEKHRRAQSHIAVGKLGEMIGHELLETHEGFDTVRQPTERFQGQPFDRLGRKRGAWYIVEIKTGRHGIGSGPSRVQKKRMEKVLNGVRVLEPCLVQIDLQNAKYKIRFGQEVRDLIAKHERKEQPISHIIEWVKRTIDEAE